MKFLSVTEEDYSSLPPNLPKILGFEAKWEENSPYYQITTIKARSVNEETQNFMNECTSKLCERLSKKKRFFFY